MRTVKRNPFLSGICAILGGAFLWAGVASADVTSDRTAGILVIPKLIYSSVQDQTLAPLLKPPGAVIDTEIQVTNTSDQDVKLRCFYVNANSHCSNAPNQICFTKDDCQPFGAGGLCFEGWIEIDFEFTLSPRQPLIWRLSDGLFDLPLPSNTGSIPGANEDPFMGELKCVQVGEDDQPIDRNDVKGEATIITASETGLDARAYNAIGIQAIPEANDGDNTLILGGDEAEYDGCPSILILDHFFDDAQEPLNNDYVKTHLTLVPCSENFELQDLALFNTTVQFLVFNEFEQRFSASRPIRCFKEFELCALGTGLDRSLKDVNPASNSCQRSVFSAYVAGTLTGQTRIRGVDDGSAAHGNGLLGVAEEFHRRDAADLSTTTGTAAFNLHQPPLAERSTPDILQLP